MSIDCPFLGMEEEAQIKSGEVWKAAQVKVETHLPAVMKEAGQRVWHGQTSRLQAVRIQSQQVTPRPVGLDQSC